MVHLFDIFEERLYSSEEGPELRATSETTLVAFLRVPLYT
jgi:hypothetical protein